jgi:hypothetical protein
MRFKHLSIISTVFVASMVFAVNLVTITFLNKNLLAFAGSNNQQKSASIKPVGKCSNTPENTNLYTSQDAHLKALAQYQQLCKSLPAKRLMVFTNMPKDKADAQNKAKAMAPTLKEFNKNGITPVVIVEPETEWGLVDFSEFETGFYDEWIKDYFEALKQDGINDQSIGTWVPFPEANLPYWNHQNAKPADFSIIVNKYLGILKSQFPSAKGSVLLNSATYDNEDFDWANGEYVSLVQYTKNLNPKLVDSFGLQGFPWMPPKDKSGNGVFDAKEYLNFELADEAARSIGVKEIWFNTGTFGAKYTLDENKTVYVNAEKRKDTINGIVAEAAKAKSAGYNVWLNIFAEDKSNSSEATNWSYLSQNSQDQKDGQVFLHFISELESKNIDISLYDTTK